MPNLFDRSKKDQPDGDQVRVTIREDQSAPGASNPELRPASSYGADTRDMSQAMTPFHDPRALTTDGSGSPANGSTNPVLQAMKGAGQSILGALRGQVPMVLNVLAGSLSGLSDAQRTDLKKRLDEELGILIGWCAQAESAIIPNGRRLPNPDQVKGCMLQLERVTLELVSMYNRYANQIGRTDPRMPAIAANQLAAQDSGKMRKFSNDELQKLVFDMGRHAQYAVGELKRVLGTVEGPGGDNPMSLAWVIDQLLLMAQSFSQTQNQLRQEMYKDKKENRGIFRG